MIIKTGSKTEPVALSSPRAWMGNGKQEYKERKNERKIMSTICTVTKLYRTKNIGGRVFEGEPKHGSIAWRTGEGIMQEMIFWGRNGDQGWYTAEEYRRIRKADKALRGARYIRRRPVRRQDDSVCRECLGCDKPKDESPRKKIFIDRFILTQEELEMFPGANGFSTD